MRRPSSCTSHEPPVGSRPSCRRSSHTEAAGPAHPVTASTARAHISLDRETRVSRVPNRPRLSPGSVHPGAGCDPRLHRRSDRPPPRARAIRWQRPTAERGIRVGRAARIDLRWHQNCRGGIAIRIMGGHGWLHSCMKVGRGRFNNRLDLRRPPSESSSP